MQMHSGYIWMFLDNWGIQGPQMLHSVFLGMSKLDLWGRVVTDKSLGCRDMILAIWNNAR